MKNDKKKSKPGPHLTAGASCFVLIRYICELASKFFCKIFNVSNKFFNARNLERLVHLFCTFFSRYVDSFGDIQILEILGESELGAWNI